MLLFKSEKEQPFSNRQSYVKGMNMRKKNRILIAVDGSEQSIDAVRYVSTFFIPEKTSVLLLHVLAEVPEAFLDIRNDSAFTSQAIYVTHWQTQIKKNTQEFMKRAEQILISAGYAEPAVKVKIQKRKVGIARDIINESENGYDLIVVGRSGTSRLKDVVVGSVAYKVVHRIQDRPIAVIGDKPDTQNVVVAFDGSESSFKGVDTVCNSMWAPKRHVTLCHVIRSLNIHLGVQKIFTPDSEEEWVQKNADKIKSMFNDAKRRLMTSGFNEAQIDQQILKNKVSRAASIKKYAETKGFGTIVVGRRGLTFVQEFLMGRVSRKILHMADRLAVWVV